MTVTTDNSQQKKYYAVPEPPIVHAIISRYSYSSGNTTGFIVQFNEIVSSRLAKNNNMLITV